MSLRNGISLLSTSNRDHDFNHDYDYDYEDRDASLFGIILSPLPTSSFTSNARSFSTSSSANTTTTNQPQPLTQPKALQTIIPTPLLDRIKSPTLWFDDGNIILAAQNTIFKVHKSLLAKHSEVFRDLFLVPQPEYLYDGLDKVVDGKKDGGLGDGLGDVGARRVVQRTKDGYRLGTVGQLGRDFDGIVKKNDEHDEGDDVLDKTNNYTGFESGGSVGVVSPIGDGETGVLEVLDGLPVVYLADDETELSHLLNALYDRSYYSKHERTPLKTVAALLRLSTKYEIKDLRTDTIQHLSPLYPSTIEDFDALMSHMAGSKSGLNSLGGGFGLGFVGGGGAIGESGTLSTSFGGMGRVGRSTRGSVGSGTTGAHRATSLSPSRYGYSDHRDSLLHAYARATRFDLIENNDPITVINLARETGVDHFLPSALYFCATRSLRQLFASSNPYPNSNSTKSGSSPNSNSSSGSSLGVCSKLSFRDLEACVVGREKLMRAHRQIVWKFLDSGKDSLREHHILNYPLSSPTNNVSSPITSSSPTATFASINANLTSNATTSSLTSSSNHFSTSPPSNSNSNSTTHTSSTTSHDSCTRAKMLFMASSAWRHIAYEPDVFEPQDSLINESVLASMCESCLGGLRRSVLQGRRDVWNTLPRYFRLEDWEKLVATTVSSI